MVNDSFPDHAYGDPFAAAPTVQWFAMTTAQVCALARDEAALFSRQFSCRWPRRGDAEHLAQLFTVTGHHDIFLASTRSTDVEQLLLHRISGKNNCVHCLSLAAMRGDSIAVIELRSEERRVGKECTSRFSP